MSEHATRHSSVRRHGDRGFTLPEVLIAVVLMGLIMGSMSSAVIVTLKQMGSTSGRLNNARSEQGVGVWMPADLASAQRVDTSPSANPCAPQTCPPSGQVVGSNALMFEWTTKESNGSTVVDRITRVAYIYALVGDEYQLIRVHCTTLGGGWTCSQQVALHDLEGPPPGVEFVPGVTVPEWVIVVTEPLDPASTGEEPPTTEADPGWKVKNARRVVVTINGGGERPGGGGGVNQISYTAGSTDSFQLDTTSLAGAPTFNAARSRCGGNIALIVDESGSIGSTAIVEVRNAITNFVQLFAGTPVKLEIVRFDSTSSVLGATGWSRWFDMLNENDVATLTGLIANLRSNGGTNWEDAWFRTFFNSDGTVQAVIPDLVVFFTDGVPTYSRLNQSSASAPTNPPAPQGYSLANGSSYNQEAWYRANYIAQQFRSTVRFIGVGVGPDMPNNSNWLTAPVVYERGYHLEYQRYGRWYEVSNKVLWQRNASNTYQRSNRLIYERLVSGSWTSTTQSLFDANNTTPDESDGWRTRVGSGSPTWSAVNSNAATSRAIYDAANSVAGESDGWRSVGSTSGSWTSIPTTQAQYMASNTVAGSSDGWRTSVSSTSNVTWTEVPKSTYDLSNTTSDESDGWAVRGTSSGWTTITKAMYDANPGDPNFRVVNVYSAPYDLWEPVSQSVYNSTPSAGRRTNASSVTQSTPNSVIISRLIAGNDYGVPAIPQAGGGYSNAAQANMYLSPNWSDFAGALQSVALAECGGTLTLQTRVGSTAAVDPFTYQNTGLSTLGGEPRPAALTVVSTTRQFTSGTFDFAFPDGQPMIVEIQPQNLSNLIGYQPAGWSCKAGVTPRSFTTFPIPNTQWTGIRVQVGPNEAVSCIQQVTRP